MTIVSYIAQLISRYFPQCYFHVSRMLSIDLGIFLKRKFYTKVYNSIWLFYSLCKPNDSRSGWSVSKVYFAFCMSAMYRHTMWYRVVCPVSSMISYRPVSHPFRASIFFGSSWNLFLLTPNWNSGLLKGLLNHKTFFRFGRFTFNYWSNICL